MYDKLFSQQWIFDRCLEGEHFFIPLNLTLFALILLILFFLFKKAGLNKNKLILLMIGSGVVLLPLTFLSSFLIGIFSSADWQFWQGVNPANELYSKVKYVCSKNNCPRSEKELSELDPILYSKIVANAKSKYSYNPMTKKYIWYVRPSYYYMVSFEGNGFGVFKIPEIFNISHWEVPEFRGEIDKLPNK